MVKANAGQKPKALKGAVLIMVLTVMTVLIIMLVGAMALVSSANSRAITKYEETQAYYTARSALDVFTNDLMNDINHKDYDAAGNGTLTSYVPGRKNTGLSTKAGNVINKDNLSQAQVLAEAIYGKRYEITDPVTGDVQVYYDTSKSLRPLQQYDYSALDSEGNPKLVRVKDADLDQTYMSFKVTDPNLTGLTTSDSGLLAAESNDSIIIKVQLTRLTYDDGTDEGIQWDDYNNKQKTKKSSGDVTSNSEINSKKVNTYIDLAAHGGLASFKYIKECAISVSSTAVCGENTALVSKIITPVEPPKSKPGVGLGGGTLQLNNNNMSYGPLVMKDPGEVNENGVSTPKDFVWRNQGTVIDSVFVNGNVKINVDKTVKIGKGESVVFNGNYLAGEQQLRVKNDKTADAYDADTPFVFINGTYTSNNKTLNTGDVGKPVNVIVRNLDDTSGSNDFINVIGNLYVDGYAKFTKNINSKIDGDIYISDCDAYEQAAIGTAATADLSNKSEIGGVNYSVAYGDQVVDGVTWKNTLTLVGTWPTGGGVFCSDKLPSLVTAGHHIYYYYREVDSGASKYIPEGCVVLEAIRRYFALHPSEDVNGYRNLLVPIDSDDMKHLIKLGYSDPANKEGSFIDGVSIEEVTVDTHEANKVIIDKKASFDILITLPEGNASSKSATRDPNKLIHIPTLAGTLSCYVSKNDTVDSSDPKYMWFMDGTKENLLNKISFKTPDVNRKYDGTSRFKQEPLVSQGSYAILNSNMDLEKAYGQLFVANCRGIKAECKNGSCSHGSHWFVNDKNEYNSTAAFEGVFSFLNSIFDSAGVVDNNVAYAYDMEAPVMANLDCNDLKFSDKKYLSTLDLTTVGESNIIKFNSGSDFSSAVQKIAEEDAYKVEGSKAYVVDTSDHYKVMILETTGGWDSYSGTIVVRGKNPLYVLVCDKTKSLSDFTYAFPSQVTFNNFRIIDEELCEHFNSSTSDKYYICNSSDFKITGGIKITAPKTRMYVDRGIRIKCENQCFFDAYIYGAYASFINGNTKYGLSNLYYDDKDNSVSVNLGIIGSLYMRSLKLDNNFSVVYVNPDQGGDDEPGKDIIRFNPTRMSGNTDIMTKADYVPGKHPDDKN